MLALAKHDTKNPSLDHGMPPENFSAPVIIDVVTGIDGGPIFTARRGMVRSSPRATQFARTFCYSSAMLRTHKSPQGRLNETGRHDAQATTRPRYFRTG
jgi:hypothetical protein